MKIQRLRTTLLRDHSLWRLKDGTKAFVKISATNYLPNVNMTRVTHNRERTILEVLKGLAVPEVLHLNPREIPNFRDQKNILYLALSFAGAHTVHHLNLKTHELIGSWLFVAEQLAAFRRHQLLYCDLKCANIMATKKPFKVTIIDFDFCSPLIANQKYLKNFNFTDGFQAPEVLQGKKPTEKTLVYQQFLVLFHFLTDGDNQMLSHSKRGLTHAKRILENLGSPDLSKLLSECLDNNPNKRPKNYEEVLKKLKKCKLPTKIKKTWDDLRRPYIERLAEIGL